jgi:hypothetical protein
MVTVQLPFAADTVTEWLRKITSARYSSPELLHPALSWEARAIIHKCLQKKPARRYATARELLQDATRLAGMAAPLQQCPTPARPPGPMMHRLTATVHRQWPLWVSGGALVMLIIGGIFLARQPIEPVPVFHGPHALPSLLLRPAKDDGIDKNQTQQWAPVRINAQNGNFAVYQNGSRLADTPWQFDAPVGSHVRAILKREGFKDVAIDFQVKEHGNEYTYTPEHSGR